MRLITLNFFAYTLFASLWPLPALAANWGQASWNAFEWQAMVNVPLPAVAVVTVFVACVALVSSKANKR
jgi:NADH:ubiquinone oxidoreductase subunit 4 (subunit M)